MPPISISNLVKPILSSAYLFWSRRELRLSILLSLVLLNACGGGGGGGNNNAPADTDGDGVVDSDDVDIDNDGLIEISNLQQLDWIRHDVEGTSRNDGAGNANSDGCPPVDGCNGYELITDLNFDTNGDNVIDNNDTYFDYDGDGNGNGWLPIPGLMANFNGNGHTIRNLFIDRPLADAETNGEDIGLFGSLNRPRIEITNLNISGGSINGHENVGSLSGTAGATSQWFIRNYHSDIPVTGVNNVGGLIGFTGVGATIQQSSTAGNVTATGNRAGGLTGQSAFTSIRESEASGSVSSTGDYAGGLVGYGFPVNINNSIARGTVSAANFAGGLIGSAENNSDITFSEAHGDVTSTNNYAGGLIGFIRGSGSSVSQSYATGNVSGINAVGGFVGSINIILSPSNITNNIVELAGNFSTSSITATNNYVGGFVGISYHTNITASFATGPVTGNQFVGGFNGDANTGSTLTANFSTGLVTGNSDEGGFVGFSDNATYVDNHYANDSSGQTNAIGTVFGAGNVGAATDATGATLAELQCPTDENDTLCAVITLYENWLSYTDAGSTPYWDFGTTTQLPGLNFNGTIFRDSNGDGTLD